MKGYLIYHSKEAIRNQAFIELFKEAGKKYGLSFTYVSYEQYQNAPLPDLVLNRTREISVSTWYEKRKVPVFHSSSITKIGNDKFKTLEYLKEHLCEATTSQKWAPDSLFLPKEKVAEWITALRRGELINVDDDVFCFLDRYSCVIKSVSGHGGTEVAEFPNMHKYVTMQRQQVYPCVNNKADQIKTEELMQLLESFEEKDCILQEKICSDSEDVRVYIMGNQIYKAICRKGKSDFRSNFSLGGTATVYELSSEQKLWIQEFLNAFRHEVLGLAGLDFIIDKEGHLIFNELEEMVGCRMLYQYTDCDVVEDYVKWLQNFVQNNGCH